MPDSQPEGSRDSARTRPASWRRWREVQPILDAALDLPIAERPRFLAAECGNDLELKATVEDLLDRAGRDDAAGASEVANVYPRLVHEFLRAAPPAAEASGVEAPGGARSDGPAVSRNPEHEGLETLRTALAGRYAIERQVGAGGMATVYLAQDLRHDRRVALKILRPELSAVIGVGRFLSEIRMTANLQHPHILPLHDSGEVNGTAFYVMPFVEGGSLRRRLQREKQLPIDVALDIARGVARALDYAHRQGIIHRDIKPENLLLQDGQALVADFGIALAAAAGGGRMTESGMSLGTPTYMSPEQAMGERALDGRTDIYALACVLYEMLTGEPPHTGPTAQAIVAKVMTAPPIAPRSLRETIPRPVEDAILRGLRKLPADRFSTAGEFAAALDQPTTTGDEPHVRAAESRQPTRQLVWLGAIPVATLAALAAWGWLRPVSAPHAAPLARFSLPPEEAPAVPDLAISPDGTALAWVGSDGRDGWSLVMRRLDREERLLIPGTERATQPFFSVDGQEIGFLQDGQLRRVSLTSGEATTILNVSGMEGSTALNQVMYGATWGPRGQIVFAAPRGLYEVSANGGSPRLLASPDSTRNDWYFLQPAFTADGSGVLVNVLSRDYESRLALVPASGGTPVALGISGREPKHVSSGHLLYTDAQGRLFAIRLDASGRRVEGEAHQALENVALMESPARAFVDVARSGTIAFVERSEASGQDLVLVDRRGVAQSLSSERMAWRHPRFSLDGRRIAVGVDVAGASGDVWMLDLVTRRLVRLTFDSLSVHPTWSPDGKYIVFPHPRLRDGRSALFRVRVDGSASPESLLTWPRQIWEAETAPDGRTIVFRDDNAKTIRDIYLVPADSPSAPRALLGSALNERSIAIAPTGSWLAYVSNANGRDDVYLRTLSGDSPRWSISLSGGSEPRWSRDGRELYFRKGDTMFVADVRLGPTPAVGEPRALFTGQFQSSAHQALYDVSPDRQGFVMVRSAGSDNRTTIHVVLHWFDRPVGQGPR